MRKRLVFVLFFTILFSLSFAQHRCDLDNLPNSAKITLEKFWLKFQTAIKLNDTQTLSSICEFPFTVSAEVLSGKNFRSAYYHLDTVRTIEYANVIFFDTIFVNQVLACNSPTECLAYHGDYNNKHKTCCYEFFYKVQDVKGKEQIRSFSIVKFDSSYKITTNWIRY